MRVGVRVAPEDSDVPPSAVVAVTAFPAAVPAAGVTSKAGFQTAVVTSRPAIARTSPPSRCSISICAPVAVAASRVEHGPAT